MWGKLTEVVGVAEDGKYHDLEESPQPVVYLPSSQSEQGETVFVVRSRLAPNEMAAALERTLSGIEPNVPITVQSWSDTLDRRAVPGTGGDRGAGRHGPAGGDAGGDGHLRHGGLQREPADEGVGHPRGVGRAQDASNERGGRPAHACCSAWDRCVGLLAGVFASRLLGQIVYQANPRDPVVVGGAVLTMALLGVVASAIPARRALAVDPSKLMREE